jgi:hypothetical protein
MVLKQEAVVDDEVSTDEETPAKRFNMEVNDEDIVAFKKAATKVNLSMSAWARVVLRKAAGR